ncbi:hypothetical protein ACGC1H_000397 [Rhizoctonia solani]
MNRLRTNSISALFRLLRSRESREAVPRLDIALVRPDPNVVRVYYMAVKALARGSSDRPGLPLELVIHICRLAGFEVQQVSRPPKGIKEVRAWGPMISSRFWFQTEQFTKETLSRARSIQLVTMSHHQGPVDDRHAGSWSWFEIRVARPIEQDQSQLTFEVKRRPDGAEVSQRSHSHPIDEETAEQQRDFAEHRGLVFGPGDRLWDEIEEGDVLQVVMKAQFSGWTNVASDGILKINTWWEPSSEMLELIYTAEPTPSNSH